MDLKFDIPFNWNLLSVSSFLFDWLLSPNTTPSVSMVGIMSSHDFCHLMEPMGIELSKDLRILIHSASSLWVNNEEELQSLGISINELRGVSTYARKKVLSGLDSLLKPKELANCSQERLYAINLALLCAMIAISYSFSEDNEFKVIQS